MFSRFQAIWSSRKFAFKVLVLQLLFSALVLLDIPIIRPAFGFLYLMFIPGIVLLRLFRLENLERLEMILFSVGFSIAFLIFAGFLINAILPLGGISRPLTEMPLMLVLNSIVLLLCFIGPRKDQESMIHISRTLKSIARAPLAALFISLPFLSVLGTIWVNAYENNAILLLMIIAISVLFVIGALVTRLLPPKLFPVVILMIAISVLFHRSLISRFLLSGGSDILVEHSVFKITQNSGLWDPVSQQHLGALTPALRFYDMLSITVLPTVFSSLLNMDATSVLKILYPLIFSFVPLILYSLWQTRIGPKGALISAFLFMAQQTFYTEMLALTRQMTAELFFGLLFLVVLKAKMKPLKRVMCFTIFGAALVVSHYAISVIFLCFIFSAWIVLTATKRSTRKITLTMIVLFFVTMFSWYIYTSNAATFNTILEFGDHVRNEWDQWANPASRGTTVLAGLGMEPAPSVWNSISRAFAYFIQFLIVVGFVGSIIRRVKPHLDLEYLIFTSLATALLAGLILVPALAETLNMTRFFHILLFFLAPLAVLGAEFLVSLAVKRKTELTVTILLISILIPYFLFQTNFVYEVVGSESWSLPLSKYRIDKFRLYVHDGYIDEQSAFGAQWLSENVELEHTRTYYDTSSWSVLLYYGIMYKAPTEVLSNNTKVAMNGTIYLSRFNVVYGTMVGARARAYYAWNTSDFSLLLDKFDKVYSNGASEIYQSSSIQTP